MSPLKITIFASGTGRCCLSNKETDGVVVSFDDGTVTQQHLSWRSLRQLIAMKTAGAKPAPASTSPPSSPRPS